VLLLLLLLLCRAQQQQLGHCCSKSCIRCYVLAKLVRSAWAMRALAVSLNQQLQTAVAP
jgi:hypothetical protein